MKKLTIEKQGDWWVVRFDTRPTNHLYVPVDNPKPLYDNKRITVVSCDEETDIPIEDFIKLDGDELNEKYFNIPTPQKRNG